MNIKSNIEKVLSKINGSNVKLVIVTKTKPIELLKEIYALNYRVFGENRVQELVEKYENLPKNIEWHLIGHLQSNKVKYVAPFVHTIHSVESFKLLQEINKQALKNNRVIHCLLQIYIAKEETKFGLSEQEALEILKNEELSLLNNIKIVGLMGMATNTSDNEIVVSEFKELKNIFERLKHLKTVNVEFKEISMGMSNDYLLAVKEGSTIIRVGSAIFL